MINIESILFDGRRVRTTTLGDPLLNAFGPALTICTTCTSKDGSKVDNYEWYLDDETAERSHWNWVQYLSQGNPLPADYPSDRRPS